jgi:hypothetical protein
MIIIIGAMGAKFRFAQAVLTAWRHVDAPGISKRG